MTSPSSLIRLAQVEKWYGARKVLAVDDLTLCEGDRIMLRGRNGSGKSTLLKVIARVTPPTRGSVRWTADARLQTTGYAAQAGGLYPDLTLAENLTVRSRLHGASESSDRVRGLADDLGLTSCLGRRIAELSGGFQRLSSIACALATNATCLILDEPFSGLESRHMDRVRTCLASLAPSPKILIVASPESEEISDGTRHLHMEDGRVLCAAP